MPDPLPVIGHVNKFIGRDRGGVEAVLDAEVRELARRGGRVRVLACRQWRSPARPAPAGVAVTELAAPVIASMPVRAGFARALRQLEHQCDLLHFHLPFPLAEAAALRMEKRIPWVATHHAGIHGHGQLGRWMQHTVTRPFLERVDAILVGAPPNARVASLAGLGDRVQVVPFGFDLRRYLACRRRPGGRRILFLGRLVPYKGLDVLLHAMVGLDARLEIVGDGPERGRLERLARRLNLSAAFAGHLPDAALPGRFAAAQVFVLPSRNAAETFGVAQVEAMATGLPVVNTALGTGTDWVSPDGETGLTVAPNDPAALRAALARMLDDHRLRFACGQRARERARELFTIERHGAALAGIYAGLLRRQARSQGAA